MPYTQWPIELADLDSLVLDPRNVRVREGRGDDLENEDPKYVEAAIANYMVEAEDLMSLVQDILRDGYLDNEIPVVSREESKFIVAEGNRRATALKVIANPQLLKGPSESKVERLKTRYPDHNSPTQIRIMIAPSRDAAQPLLARLHTGTSKKAWIREQQAIFYHAQLSDTVTVDDLKVQYPSQANSIPKMIQMGEMRQVIRKMKYDDDALRDFVMNSELKMTVFQYAYSPKKIQSALQLAFTKDGLLMNKQISPGQRRGLMYLLQRFKDKTLNTRSPELIAKNVKQHEAFIEHLRRIVAGESQTDPADVGHQKERGANANEPAPEVGEVAGTSGSKDKPTVSETVSTHTTQDRAKTSREIPEDNDHRGTTGPRGKNRGDTLSRLDMSGFEYKGRSAGMRRRFEELKSLDVRTFPNATADLLRTVLECSIKDYFRTKSDPIPENKTIGFCIDKLAKEFQKNLRMTGIINSMKRTGRMNSEQYFGTSAILNASNHEPDIFVDIPAVHAAWETMKPILIEIVGTPPATS